ncbi:hypothetical protein [Motilimonas sp. 1_MG-2023]|uniref:hypothetical protein n=1 Tax=Motilimonas TaxID=1914248 RepID=UPI0026E1446A|nr:hypothetical protein [Motilimonas sp. 1_MG-2023]MDO6528053.1 hypothetical protein [Motilimonas sp. 1_MG-2023]
MEQLQKFESLGLPDEYYEVCEQHPMRIGEPIEKMPYKEILKASEGKIELKKLKGPGTCLEVTGLPDSISLSFVIQSRTGVEAHIKFSAFEKEYLHSFATFSFAAKEAAAKEKPKPPYPRPQAHSLAEIVEVFVKLKGLALKFNEAIL